MTPTIPDDIQVLLDCLQSRDDLQLEEMQPLQNWIEQTPGGELVVAQAFARNDQLESALQAISIRVPKTLERQVSSYVQQNVEAAETESERISTKDRSENWMLSPRARYISGVLSGVAAILLIGSCIFYLSGLYGELDENLLAEASVDWIEELDKQNLWQAPGFRQPILPDEMERHRLTAVLDFESEYGDTSAYEFRSFEGRRGVLFVFESSKPFKFNHIGKLPDVRLASDVNSEFDYVGVGKEGEQVKILVVRATSESEFGRFIRSDFRSGIAAFLKIVWLLC